MPEDRPDRSDALDPERPQRPQRPVDRVCSFLGLRGGLVAWAVLAVVAFLPNAAAATSATLPVTEPAAMVAALLGYAGIMYLFMRLITHA